MAASETNNGLSDELLNAMVADIVADLQSSMVGYHLRKSAEVEVMKCTSKGSDSKDVVTRLLAASPWFKQLCNAVYHRVQHYQAPAHRLAAADHAKEPISYIRRAQVNWEKRVLKSMNSMCTELNVSLARRRADKEQRDMAAKWTELGTTEPDLSKFRPVYAAKDFLDVIAALKNTNQVNCGDPSVFSCYWGTVQVPLPVKDLRQLQLQLSELSISQPQTGVDDCAEIPVELFDNERSRIAATLCHTINGSPAAAQEFAKRGCPLSWRSVVWRRILGVRADDIDVMYYDQLRTHVLQHELLVDSLVYKDIKLTATNDDQYFVFEDYLYQVTT